MTNLSPNHAADPTVEMVTADLREVAVVLDGAHGDGATVTEVRQQTQAQGRERTRRVLDWVLAGLPRLPPPG